MMKAIIRTLLSGFFLLVAAQTAFGGQPPRDFFEHITRAWVVADVTVQNSIQGAAGGVVGFTATVADVAMSRVENARNVLVIFRVDADGKPEVDIKKGDVFFGPLVLSARTAHWRENLPTGPLHRVSGGARYTFLGDAAAEARRVTEAYVKIRKLTGKDRRPSEIEFLSETLTSPNEVLREDSLLVLSRLSIQPEALTEKSVGLWRDYFEKAAPDDRSTLAAVAGKNGLEVLRPSLAKFAADGNPEPLAALDQAKVSAEELAKKRAELRTKQAAKKKAAKKEGSDQKQKAKRSKKDSDGKAPAAK
jgi:hypothetical protein